MSSAGSQPPMEPGQPPSSWAWARPTTYETRQTEPLDYHRLLRGAQRYKWWKPLLVILLIVAFYFAISIAAGILLGILYPVFTGSMLSAEELESLAVPDTQNPLSLVLTLGLWAAMVPATLFAMWCVGLRPSGRIWSAALKLRWGLLWRTALAALAMLVLVNLISIALALVIPVSDEQIEDVEFSAVDPTALLWSLALVVLLVPLQATAEEMVFRGVLMQTLGSWLRSPWFGILIPSIGFALAHIVTYDFWGMATVGLMGAVAGWLVWRTGGLEAAISLHVVNNLLAFAIMATGLTGTTEQNDDGAGPISLAMQAVGYVFFIWLTLVIYRRGGHHRSRVDLIQVPVPPAAVPYAAHQGPVPGGVGHEGAPRE